VFVFLLHAAPSAQAQRGADPEGQPTQLRQGALASYWIWHDGSGYHLRTPTAHDRRIFRGRIEFSGGHGWVKAFQLGPDAELRLTHQGVTFSIPNQRAWVGLDFRMDYYTRATFTLELGENKGAKVIEHIFIGQDNSHPVSNPFVIEGW
jgi:hypothetical protein